MGAAFARAASAIAAALAAQRELSAEVHQAVIRLYDGRHWGALDGTLEAAPVLRARAAAMDRHEIVALALAALEGN